MLFQDRRFLEKCPFPWGPLSQWPDSQDGETRESLQHILFAACYILFVKGVQYPFAHRF